MGLSSGPHGIKTFVKTRFPSAVRDFPSLPSLVKATGHEPKHVAVLLDGNVMVNQVPVAVTDFDGYVKIFKNYIQSGLLAADHVFVVWDEPLHVPRTKLDEQRRRDLQRQRGAPILSEDLEAKFAPKTDDYNMETIERCNPHDLLANRLARPRFYDALCRRTMTQIMQDSSFGHKTLTFDGIDARGASRLATEPRDPDFYSSDERLEGLLRRKENKRIGEGDLKLTDLEAEIQYRRNEGEYFNDVELVVVSTIDTDSIAIELMHQSAKNEAAVTSHEQGLTTGRQIKSILCFRETTGKRKDQNAETIYACLDLEILHDLIMKELFEKPSEEVNHLHRGAMALLSAGWVLAGCDFLKLNGIRSDVVWDAVKDIVQTKPKLVQKMHHVWTLLSTSTPEEQSEARTELTAAIKAMVQRATKRLSDLPRMARATSSAKLAGTEDYEKAAWVLLYWSGLTLDSDEWGFGVA